MALGPGDAVPADLAVLTPAGHAVPLGSLLHGEQTLAIFLRHLG